MFWLRNTNINFLLHKTLAPYLLTGILTNSVDQLNMSQNVASHQGLHYVYIDKIKKIFGDRNTV